MNETLEDALGLQSAEVIIPAHPKAQIIPSIFIPNLPAIPDEDLDEEDEDEILAKKIVRHMVEKSEEIFNDITQMARETESPRAYEVLASFMKNAVDATDKLLVFSENRRIRKKASSPIESPTNIKNQNIFVGSTTELLDFVNDLKERAQQGEVIDNVAK